jgi:transcriptional regulator with XRE-family HTH domain
MNSSITVSAQPEIKPMPHEVDIHVGRKLKQARTLRRYSQTDVARRLSLSFQQIQKYEIGSNRIAASAVASIKDEQLKSRIITFIQDVAGVSTARSA